MTFEIALTGLKAASKEMEVISNNIANTSTAGFKSSNISFGDIYGSAGIGSTGNSIGRGVRVTSVHQQFAKGDISYTDNQLDLSVSGTGEGFFKLSDNGATQYSRAGAFGLDNEGYIVNGAGQKLMGYPAEDGNVIPTPGELQLERIDTAAQSTENLRVNLNLNASNEDATLAFDRGDSDTYDFTTTTTFYDSLGAATLVNFHFRKTAANTWATHGFAGDIEITDPAGETIEFNTDGSLNNVNGNNAGLLQLNPFSTGSGSNPLNVEVDLSELSQFHSSSGVNEIVQDGHSSGRLSDFGIMDDGVILGYYTNGQSRAMGQITLSNFTNPQGLQQVGNTSWEESSTSGEPLTGIPGTATLGVIQSGSLEESNVDITAQLVSMISTQRNFQANAQVITTSDALTQTVMNIKR